MDDKRMAVFVGLKTLICMILFYYAIKYENAVGMRYTLLLMLTLSYLLLGIFRRAIVQNDHLLWASFLIDIVLIFCIEYNSKYVINYLFHLFYIFIILESFLVLGIRRGLGIGVLTVLTSLFKYIYLLSYQSNYSNLSEVVFTTLLNILFLITGAFAAYYIEEKTKQDKLYDELLSTHETLRAYAEKVEALTIVEERNRVAREIHDTLGHSMTGLIMELEMASFMMGKDSGQAEVLIDRAKDTARDGLKSIRQVVEALDDQFVSMNIFESMKVLVEEFRGRTGMTIRLIVPDTEMVLEPSQNAALYRLIQEALTNGVRHGEAKTMSIEFCIEEHRLLYRITDDGVGCQAIVEGYGIKGMRERIGSVGGEIDFSGEIGFTIQGSIPFEGVVK